MEDGSQQANSKNKSTSTGANRRASPSRARPKRRFAPRMQNCRANSTQNSTPGLARSFSPSHVWFVVNSRARTLLSSARAAAAASRRARRVGRTAETAIEAHLPSHVPSGVNYPRAHMRTRASCVIGSDKFVISRTKLMASLLLGGGPWPWRMRVVLEMVRCPSAARSAALVQPLVQP